MRALFWGSPDFALPTLRALLESAHRVVGVVTRPDRPAGRGRKLRPTPVKRVARGADLPVLQPEEPRGHDFLEQLRALSPEVSVVAAYGEILREEVLELPPRGSLNVHASLLPALRGAAPIHWAIIRGHSRSGVTIMRMVRALDAGPVLLQAPVELAPTTTAGELFERLSALGAEALLEALGRLEEDGLEEREQEEAEATYAPRVDRETARIDWSLGAREVGRWIRGCDPWPAAWSELAGDPVQLFGPRPEESEEEPPGTILVADAAEGLRVAAGRGALWIEEVKPAGGRRMRAEEWIRGRGASPGDRFA